MSSFSVGLFVDVPQTVLKLMPHKSDMVKVWDLGRGWPPVYDVALAVIFSMATGVLGVIVLLKNDDCRVIHGR